MFQRYRRISFALAAVMAVAVPGVAAQEGEQPSEPEITDDDLTEEELRLRDAYEAHDAGELEEAYAIFSELAEEAGNPDAKTQLGWMYLEGHTMDPDMERAAELWEAAADAGHERAEHLLQAVLPGLQ